MYQYKASITVDNTKVSGSSNLSNFPVLISGTYDGTGSEPDLRSAANGGRVQNVDSAGGIGANQDVPADLAFFAEEVLSTQLDHEVIFYDPATGQFIARVRVPTLIYNSDTEIWLGYSDAAVTTSQENIGGTWNANYIAVAHLKEDGNTTSGGYKDSSGNANNATGVSMTASSDVVGKIYRGQELDGSADHIDFPALGTLSNYSVGYWMNVDTDGFQNVFSFDEGGFSDDLLTGIAPESDAISTPKKLAAIHQNSGDSSRTIAQDSADIALNTWHKVKVTYDGTTLRLYKNGSQVASGTKSGLSISNVAKGRIGRPGSGARFFAGKIEEAIVKNAADSAAWEATEYANENSPGTFYTMGNETLSVTTPTVTTESPASSITSNSAQGGGEVTDDGDGTVSERGIVWGTSPNPTIAGNKQASGSGTGVFSSVNMTGLDSDTHYYYRAYATNEAGTAYGSDVELDTLDAVISGTCTLGGSPVSGAIVTLIDSDTDTVVATDTSDGSGNYAFLNLDVTKEYHVVAEYDDGGGSQYNTLSLPFMTPEEV